MTNQRAITIDLWQTLIANDAAKDAKASSARNSLRINRLHNELETLNKSGNMGKLKAAVQRIQADMEVAHHNGVDRSFFLWSRQLIEYVEEKLFDRLNETEINKILAAIDEPFLVHPPSAHPAAANILETLSHYGLHIAIISNTGLTSGKIYKRWLQQLGLADYFSVFTFSHEAGVAKPSPSIFESTLEKLDATPKRTLHVGDSLHSDVGGAQKIGMPTVWLRINENTGTSTLPDYTISDLRELPDVVRLWLDI